MPAEKIGVKRELLTVKELAAELRMSVKSISEHIARERSLCSGCVGWRGSISTKSDSQWNAMVEAVCCSSTKTQSKVGATAGNRRRRAQQKRPRLVKRGRNFQGSKRRVS